MATTKMKGRRAKKVYNMDKFRKLILAKKNYSELMNDMDLPTHAACDQLLLQLCRLDTVWYPEIPGGRISDELVVGKGGTMVLSKAKLTRFEWVVEKSKFKIETEGKNIILRFIEPEVPQITE